jgi:hypothetical protein
LATNGRHRSRGVVANSRAGCPVIFNGDKHTPAGTARCLQNIPQLATRKLFEEQPIVTTTYKVAFGDKLRLPGRGQRHQAAK